MGAVPWDTPPPGAPQRLPKNSPNLREPFLEPLGRPWGRGTPWKADKCLIRPLEAPRSPRKAQGSQRLPKGLVRLLRSLLNKAHKGLIRLWWAL